MSYRYELRYIRPRWLRRLRALVRAFDAMLLSEPGRGFQRALRANLALFGDVAWWALIAFGVLYYLSRGFISLRWGV